MEDSEKLEYVRTIVSDRRLICSQQESRWDRIASGHGKGRTKALGLREHWGSLRREYDGLLARLDEIISL